ncbi:MAG: ABC-2 family transporter protein [Planctomycetes bacterium]|nr:ABC-2 family transporter protein [Planctomycetota bacterium]
MTRYLRLYASFLRFSFSRSLEFRLDFFFRVGMDALWYAVHLVFFGVLFQHTGALGGWNLDQVLVFAAALFFVDAIYMTVFSNNMWMLPILINRGDLDYYLVRPVSPLFFLSVRDFAANSFLNLVLAVSILAWALLRYPEPLPLLSVAAFGVLLLLGALLTYTMGMLFTIPIFWLHSKSGLREVGWSLGRLGARPHRIYTGWTRTLLLTLLPYAFVASYPVYVLFNGPSWQALAHTAAVVGGAFTLMVLFWRQGLRAYSSASS